MSDVEANYEPMSISTDPLNVLTSEVKPLTEGVIASIIRGRTERTQLLDGSMLEQHDHLEPYALTHVTMTFVNEADLIRCARMLQWSDERMRSYGNPNILWAWKESFRDMMTVEFSVAWYSKEFFENKSEEFLNRQHASYYSLFGMSPKDIKIRHEILKS